MDLSIRAPGPYEACPHATTGLSGAQEYEFLGFADEHNMSSFLLGTLSRLIGVVAKAFRGFFFLLRGVEPTSKGLLP